MIFPLSVLSHVEEKTICRLFGICDGYVFKYSYLQGTYNKNDTQRIILDACGIDIYKEPTYRTLSQEKCVRKIWNECNPKMIAKLLSAFCDYFCFYMGTSFWPNEDQYDFNQVQKIIERLDSITEVNLPKSEMDDKITVILEDITNNMNAQKPELAIDRLHTFCCEYLRFLCKKHGIDTLDNKGHEYPLHSLVGNLNKWYEKEGYIESEFTNTAIKSSISLFEKYNHVRNNQSAAHPNNLLSKNEATYVVKIIADTLEFLDILEQSHKSNNSSQTDFSISSDEWDTLPF